MQIHEKIKQARLSAKLTEDELAKKLGVKRSTYQYWETKTPKVDKIKLIAEALSLPKDYFFGNNDENLITGKEIVKSKEDRMLDSINDLTNSNSKHADAALIREKNQEKLINLLVATAGADRQNLEDLNAKLQGLQEYVIEFSAHLKKVKPKEIEQVLGSKVKSVKDRAGNKDTPSGVGR